MAIRKRKEAFDEETLLSHTTFKDCFIISPHSDGNTDGLVVPASSARFVSDSHQRGQTQTHSLKLADADSRVTRESLNAASV